MRIRNHASRLTALLLLALCAQMLLPLQTPSAYATETSIEDFGPSLGVYPNRDYTGLYKIDAQILAHDAAQAIQAAVDLGLCESAADLALERAVPLGNETIYQLRQVYEGIPVLNRRATVLTDAQGVVRAAGGDCVPLEGINTQPALGWAEIAQALSAYLRGAHHLGGRRVFFGRSRAHRGRTGHLCGRSCRAPPGLRGARRRVGSRDRREQRRSAALCGNHEHPGRNGAGHLPLAGGIAL